MSHPHLIDWHKVIRQFEIWNGPAESDSYRDFLGVRTRLRYMPPPYMDLAGQTEGQPGSDRAGLQDIPEWAGTLQAVLDARDEFSCAELGAGFGPFLVGSAVAAKQRGIKNILLVAVEAAESHVEWLREHFRDNGIDPDQHRILLGAAGTYDGMARFPKLHDPASEWGGEAVYTGKEGPANRTPQANDNFVEVPCFTLKTILDDLQTIDVAHFDIQGAEFDVIEQGIDTLNLRVRRLVVGTHGRDIEHSLLKILDTHGWVHELDKACSFQQTIGGITLLQDGVQVWRNPRLLP